MKRAIRFLLFVLAFVPVLTHAQVQTGTPPFGAFGGGPDIINLANLNAHLTIPVFSKAGRGTNFIYDLSYDSSIWYPVGSSGSQSWQPIGTVFVPVNGNGVGRVFRKIVSVICPNPDYPPTLPKTIRSFYMTNFAYTDRYGVSHAFPGLVWENDGCQNTGAESQLASDGSGYTINLDAYGVATVTASNGAFFNPPIPTGTAGSMTDPNGNEITENSSGVFTDTLGTTVLTVAGSSPTTFTYAAPNGQNVAVTVNYTSATVKTNFGCSGIAEFGPNTESLISSITYPDGSAYKFTYEPTPGFSGDVTGRVASITLPTGGTITYSYSGGNNGITCADGSTATLMRTVNPGGTWTYAHTESGGAWTTTVTDPQGNQTVYDFQGIYQTERKVYQGSSTLLEDDVTCYNGNTTNCNATAISLPITQRIVTDTLGSQQCKHVYSYNANGLLTEQDDYDYGNGSPGPLLRKELISYASLSNNIVDAPSQITIENGSSTVVAQTNIAYDGTAVVATSGTPQQVPVTGSRGNPTSVSYTVAGSTTLTKSFTYFDTGNVQTATDVNGATTTYNYPDATSTCGNAFPTSVSEPLGLSRSMAWNCTGGVETSATDGNGQTVSAAWNDAYYWRPASTADQENNQTAFYYQPNAQFSAPYAVVRTLTFNGGNSIASDYQDMDGLGRTVVNQHLEQPGGSTLDSVSYAYDSNGRLDSTSGPCATGYGESCSGPTTTQTYDALNRPLQTTDGGGGTVSLSYSANDVLQIIGPQAGSENLKERQMEYNSLGELTSVCEITSVPGSGSCGQNTPATGYLTKYTYDALGDLLTVTQNAQSSPTQSRTFTYDGLGRMTSESNPENGTKTYTYDSDPSGKCAGPYSGDLVKRVDNGGSPTCYAYDGLHRALSVAYPNNPMPNKYFVYDSATVDGTAMGNAKTRLAEAYTANCVSCSKITDEGFSYSPRGEVASEYQSTPHSNGYYVASATYWANGVLDALTAATGYANSYNVDGEGRVYSSSNGNLSSTTYNAASEPTIVIFGSLDSDSFTYDPNTFRMTQYKYNVNGQSVTGNLTWNANGTLNQLAITDPFNAANTQTCNYTHDDLARLASANCGSQFSDTYSYDALGNLTKSGTYSFQPGYNNNNQMGGTSYDANGDVTSDGLHNYQWDVETRPTTIDSTSMTYDALGRMVEQGSGSSYTEIQYSPTGFKMQLMNGQTAQKAFVPLPAGTAGVWVSGTVYYRHADWLGSSRFASTTSRTMYNDLAYTPFGVPYAQAGATGVTDISFAGNNEDTTTSLYDAQFREYGIQGRWPSPDPAGVAAANPANPQSWNRYAYALNSPLNLIDNSGLGPCPMLGQNDPAPPGCPQGGSSNSGCTIDGVSADCGLANSGIVGGFGSAFESEPVWGITGWDVICVNGDCNEEPQYGYLGDQNVLVDNLGDPFPQAPFSPPTLPNGTGDYQAPLALLPPPSLPTVCGGGVFAYGGLEGSKGNAEGFAGGLLEYDSNQGASASGLVEAGKKNGPGGGAILNSRPTPLFFLPVLGEAGVVFFNTGVGVYVGDAAGPLGYGAGAYVNLKSAASCQAIRGQ